MSDTDSRTWTGRRGYLSVGATALTALVAGCAGGGGDGGDGGDEPDRGTVSVDDETATAIDDYLSDTGNYDGDVLDYTDESNPTVDVGASGNGGNFAFGPAALAVSTGTTITPSEEILTTPADSDFVSLIGETCVCQV